MPQPTKNPAGDLESIDPKAPSEVQPDANEDSDEEARIPQRHSSDKDDSDEDSELDDDDVEEIDLDDLDAMEGPDA